MAITAVSVREKVRLARRACLIVDPPSVTVLPSSPACCARESEQNGRVRKWVEKFDVIGSQGARLPSQVDADIAVIGAGVVGLAVAHRLATRAGGRDSVVVVERNESYGR